MKQHHPTHVQSYVVSHRVSKLLLSSQGYSEAHDCLTGAYSEAHPSATEDLAERWQGESRGL